MNKGLGSISSPHYYYGRSIIRFVSHLIATQIGIFKRRGLTLKAKRDLKMIQNSKIDKTCLVIGGGPSINRLKWEKIKHLVDDVIVTNNFHLTKLSSRITPDYICLSDPNSFLASEGKRYQIRKQLWEFVQESGATVISPYFYRKYKFPKSTSKIFFDDREFFTFNKNISPLKPRAYSSMTFLKALAVAVFMGYRKIYIIGLDNTEFIGYEGNINNELFLNYRKFYGEQEIEILSENRLNLDFFPDGLAGRFQSYSHLFGDLSLFQCFNIVNLDTESLITNFKKENFN